MSCYNFLSGRSCLLNPRIPNVASLPIPSFLIPEFRQYTNCVLKISKKKQKKTQQDVPRLGLKLLRATIT